MINKQQDVLVLKCTMLAYASVCHALLDWVTIIHVVAMLCVVCEMTNESGCGFKA